MKFTLKIIVSIFGFNRSECRRDSSVGPGARTSPRKTKNYVPMCLCAFVPVVLILDFGFWISAFAQPGVWETHGPSTHAQTTAFYADSTTSRLYVATADQGVYVSDIGGSSWESLFAPLDTARITNFIKIDGTLFAAQPGNLYSSADGWTWIAANPPAENLQADDNTELHENFIVNFNGALYAGTLWGLGLFTSSDDGENWEFVSTLLDAYTISTFLAVGDTLFAATLENGVYYSADGVNWNHCGTIFDNKSIDQLLCSGDMLLVGGESGLFISSEGISWNAAPPPLDTSTISMLCSDSGFLYAGATAGSSGLYYSIDNGANWNQTLTGEKVHCMCSAGGQHYVGTGTGIFSCPSGTNDWQAVSLHPDPGAIIDLSISQDAVYALSKQGIYKTPVGENVWFTTEKISNTPRLHNLILSDYYILTYGNKVYRSTDHGDNWETAEPPVAWGTEKIVKILTTNDGFIAVARGIFHSQNGIDWDHISSALDNTTITTLEKVGDNFLVGTESDGIFYSGDGGYNWIQANAPMDSQYVYFIYQTENKLFSGTKNGLYSSENVGADWTKVSGFPDSVTVISFTAAANRLLAGTTGKGIYFSTDNGLTWNQCAAPLNNGHIDKLFNHLWVVIAGTDEDKIYISQNYGRTWLAADLPVGNVQLTDFSFVDDILFLSTWDKQSGSACIFRSIDNGISWTKLNYNLHQNAPCLAPLYLPLKNRLYTCGDGVSFQIFDRYPPVITKFEPVDKSEFLADEKVQFYIEANGADSMILSVNSDFSDARWQKHQSPTELTVQIRPEPITVYVRCKDISENISNLKSREIQFDVWPAYFDELFMENDDPLDTCGTDYWGFRKNLDFEELRDASPGQMYNFGTHCWDFGVDTYAALDPQEAKDRPVVQLIHWSAGETSSSADTVLGWQPICPNDWNQPNQWLYYKCWLLQIPGAAIGNRGLDFRVCAHDKAGNYSTLMNRKHHQDQPLDIFSIPVQLRAQHLGQSEVLPGGTDVSNCRIVSVPLHLKPAFPFRAENLGNYGDFGPDGDWMFWAYEGEGEDKWQSSRYYQLQDGGGYFLLLRDSKAIKPITPFGDTLTTARTTAGVWGDIPGWQLRGNDWTLIGNPYQTRIELGQLKLKNRNIRLDQAGTAVGIYAYTNVGWTQDDIALEPWRGLAVFLADSADVIVFANSKEPYAPPALGKTKQSYTRKVTDLEKSDWLVQIRAEAGAIKDNTNYFGVRSDAQSDHDVYDSYEPPRLPGGISVCFPHKDWSIPTSYASDIRAVTDDGYVWPLQVSAEGGTAVSMQFESLGTLPENFQLWLIDEVTSIARDLRAQPQIQVRIPDGSTTKNFNIIVGNESFIQQNSDGLNTIPSDFVLYQNYPNPFNPLTVIRYALPVEGRVTLQIYDVQGRLVKVIEESFHREPGYYETVLDMSHYASGLYFYSIDVAGVKQFTDVKKMVYLR